MSVHWSIMPSQVMVVEMTTVISIKLYDARWRGYERWQKQGNNEKLMLVRTSQLNGCNLGRTQGSKMTEAQKCLQHVADVRCSRK